MKHSFKLRVYYEDTDAAGIVYYANHLKFAERARTEILRGLHINQSDLLSSHGVGFVVRKCTADYFKPASLDDSLTIHTELHDITGASLIMHQTVMRGDEKLVTLSVKLAVIKRDGRPTRMPDHVFAALQSLISPIG